MNKLSLTAENIINCIHNEPSIWDTELNASEGDKELAWRRIGDAFGDGE